MNRSFVFVAFLCLVGCESDERKLERLEGKKLIDCLVARSDAGREDSVRSEIDGSAARKRLIDSLETNLTELRDASDRRAWKDYERIKQRGDAQVVRLKAMPATAYMADSGDTSPANVAYLAKHRASGLDTLEKNRRASETKCKLATREYERFMR